MIDPTHKDKGAMKNLYEVLVVIIFISTLPLSGCASFPYEIRTIDNDSKKYTIHRMEGNVVREFNVSLSLNVQQFIKNTTGAKRYSLIVVHRSHNWLFIKSGESLKLIIDGKSYGYTGDGSRDFRDERGDGEIMERAWYAVTLADLKRIANAETVQMKISGTQYHETADLTGRNIERFQEFLDYYVE